MCKFDRELDQSIFETLKDTLTETVNDVMAFDGITMFDAVEQVFNETSIQQFVQDAVFEDLVDALEQNLADGSASQFSTVLQPKVPNYVLRDAAKAATNLADWEAISYQLRRAYINNYVHSK